MLGVFYFIYFVYICSMVSDRLKNIIFKKLYKELSKVEIIPYQNNIYFIDRNEKYWYFEYEKNGKLWWRYDFFSNLFLLFSLEREEYEQVMSEWVEEVLNCKVSTTQWGVDCVKKLVEEVLNCKVSTTSIVKLPLFGLVEEVLNCKVSTKRRGYYCSCRTVEEVLNCKVSEIASVDGIIPPFIDKILDN